MLAVFLDSETNGLNPVRHQIVEIACKILNVETGEEKVSYHALLSCPKEAWKESDRESLKVNGFSWDEVQGGKSKAHVAEEIEALFAEYAIVRGQALFICQNPSFDRAFFGQIIDPDRQEKLLWPYHWLDLASMFWALALRGHAPISGKKPWEIGLSKDKIAAAYTLGPEAKPHRAMEGVNHLVACYQAVVGFPRGQ